MKKLFYISVLALLFLGCSKSDDNSSDENTFLRKYEGTVWTITEEGQTMYIRFINDTRTPIEYWIEFEDCYFYILDRMVGDNKITENSEDRLVFKYFEDDDGVEYLDIVTITVSGNSLRGESEFYENGVLVETDIQILSKSTDDVDNLILCE